MLVGMWSWNLPVPDVYLPHVARYVANYQAYLLAGGLAGHTGSKALAKKSTGRRNVKAYRAANISTAIFGV